MAAISAEMRLRAFSTVHHRAQILYIMENLGLKDLIEGDALGWESVARGWGWSDGGSCGRPVGEWDY